MGARVTENRMGSLSAGLRCLRHGRLVLLLAATTIGLALLPAFALQPSLQQVFAKTLAGDHILRNHPDFAPVDVLEFFHERRAAIAGARQAAIAAGLLGIVLQIFFAGGFVETLAGERTILLSPFFSAASRHFGHNLKCFVIFLAAIAAGLLGWLGATAALGEKLFEDSPPGDSSRLLYRIGTAAVALLLVGLLSLLHDFARLARRHEPGIGGWRAWGVAGRLVFGSLFSAFGLLIFWFLAGGALWVGILALEWGTPAISIAAILLHTALQIAAVAVRSAIRVGAWGSYAAFFDRRHPVAGPETEVPTPETPEPLLTEPIPPLDSLGGVTLT